MADDKKVRFTEGYQPLKKGYQPVAGTLNPTAPSSGSGIGVAVVPTAPAAPVPVNAGDSAQTGKK